MYDNNQQPINGIANGAVAAFRIVRRDPTTDDKVEVCGANERPSGVGPDYAVADGVALPVFVGGVAQVVLGDTVAVGDRVKSDSNGAAVPIATSGTVAQNSVGIVLRAGVSGDVVPMQIDIDTIDSNLTIS